MNPWMTPYSGMFGGCYGAGAFPGAYGGGAKGSSGGFKGKGDHHYFKGGGGFKGKGGGKGSFKGGKGFEKGFEKGGEKGKFGGGDWQPDFFGDPRRQIERAQRQAKQRDRGTIGQAQRSAQLRFEK